MDGNANYSGPYIRQIAATSLHNDVLQCGH